MATHWVKRRVANCPGFASTVPKLAHCVPDKVDFDREFSTGILLLAEISYYSEKNPDKFCEL